MRIDGSVPGHVPIGARLLLALGAMVCALVGACGPPMSPPRDVAPPECRFPSGRVCPLATICAGEGAQSCATCLCEVTGELSCAPRVCDGGASSDVR